MNSLMKTNHVIRFDKPTRLYFVLVNRVKYILL